MHLINHTQTQYAIINFMKVIAALRTYFPLQLKTVSPSRGENVFLSAQGKPASKLGETASQGLLIQANS